MWLYPNSLSFWNNRLFDKLYKFQENFIVQYLIINLSLTLLHFLSLICCSFIKEIDMYK
jgi:hypothetical protein